MTVLLWIVAASIAGGALSAHAQWVSALVSYAIGALLGAVFLDILPEAIEIASSPAAVSGTVMFGIMLFFTLEILLLWRQFLHLPRARQVFFLPPRWCDGAHGLVYLDRIAHKGAHKSYPPYLLTILACTRPEPVVT